MPELGSQPGKTAIRERPLPYSDPDRIARLRDRDTEEWSNFFEEYHGVFQRALYTAFSRSRGGLPIPCGEERTELLVDLFAYCYERFPSSFREYRGEARLRSFLFEMARLWLLERRRSPRHGVFSDVGVDSGSIDDENHADPLSDPGTSRFDRLVRCLHELPVPYRSLVHLYYYAGERRTLEEVAGALEIGLEAAKKRHRRALSRLGVCLRRDGGSPEVDR